MGRHPSAKKKSVRLSSRMKRKIEVKVRGHEKKKTKKMMKKARKEEESSTEVKIHEHEREKTKKARKGGKSSSWIGSSKKDLVVAPNLCSFKQQIEELNQAKSNEEVIIEEDEMEMDVADPDALVQIMQDAQDRARGFVDDESEGIISSREKLESITLAKEFKKVVAAADVILEVVDARDPLGTRCKVVEETVLQHPGKRLVIVVNKADLVPRDVLEKWLTYLRQSRPAVPFKASVQQQAQKLGRRAMVKKSKQKKTIEKLMSVSSSVGVEFLMKLLANYRRCTTDKSEEKEVTLTIGVVGVPNVGKSSVINSLKRSKSCKVGAEPGVTRTLQSVQISKFLKILDSPGIVMADPIQKNNAILCLKNLVRADKLNDPVQAAQAILVRATKEQMMKLYNVSDYSTPEEFLRSFAKRFGLLGKQGIPDIAKAARVLVQDWNRGKIRFYTLPPEPKFDRVISARILTEPDYAKEFNLDDFKTMETNLLSVIGESAEGRHCAYLPITDNDDSTLMNTNKVVVDESVRTTKKGKLRWRKKPKADNRENNVVMLTSAKKLQKLAAKKKRKEEARLVAKRINDAMDIG